MRFGTPLDWHFKVGERLVLVSDPSERDVKVRNSQVLDRIGIDLLGKKVMDSRVWDWIGVAFLVQEGCQ